MREDVPRLARGVELIGQFEDSGFKDPPFLARRRDGQVVQMAPVLFALAEEVDGRSSSAEIALRLSDRIRRGVTAEMVEMLIDEQLHPLGIVATAEEGTTEHLRVLDPLLALKFRTKVVPESWVRTITWLFQPLFAAPVVIAVVCGFLALDGWLFVAHGISQSLRHVLYDPALVLMLLGGAVLATAFHEIGHATACRYGGAKPGVMGVGIYLVWPAFYTDITDSYRLGKRGRLRTDLGGMYFNAVFALAVAGAYLATGFEPLLLLVALQTFAILQQALPFLRLDGYYVISDLTGVPDILGRIKPILLSLVPGRPTPERVSELKPWVRGAVTAYVALLVPAIAFVLLIMLIHAPRVFSTAYDSFLVQYHALGPAFAAGQSARGLVDVLQMTLLVLPALGMVLTSARIGRRVGTGSWRWSSGNVPRRGAVLAAMAAFMGALAFLWWPNGEYRPIQPGERGTLGGAIDSIAHIPTGRPALTVQRQAQLGGAPSLSQSPPSAAPRTPAPVPGPGRLHPPAAAPRPNARPKSIVPPSASGTGTTTGESPTQTDTTTTETAPPSTTDTQTQQSQPPPMQPSQTQTQTTQTQTTQTQTQTQPQQSPPPSDGSGTSTTPSTTP